jgi:NTP pyrophosphatase (non-canonical NTP hydrolase)
MDFNEYTENAKVTECPYCPENVTAKTLRLLHGALGLASEAGEFADMIKAHVFYGKDIDATNAKEELGDLAWFLAITLDALGLSFEEVTEANIRKLKARFGDKFDRGAALNRDKAKEIEALENVE